MKIEFDAAKNVANEIKHGILLSSAGDLEWAEAVIREDRRFPYTEARFSAAAMLHGRLHIVVFTFRGESMRVISLREANARERRRHEEA